MLKKRKLYIAGFAGIVVILACIMWHRAHMSYSFYDKVHSNQKEIPENGLIAESKVFPDTYTEKITDRFTFEAEIITGENFNSNQIYDAMAVYDFPDHQKWSDIMLLEPIENYDCSEVETSSVHNVKGISYSWNNENVDYLLLDVESMFYWKQPQMNCMSGLFHLTTYDPCYNMNVWNNERSLENFSREAAWEVALQKLELTGMDTSSLTYDFFLTMRKDTLQEQQDWLRENNAIEEDDLMLEWTEADEGYFFWCYQTVNGLMIYPGVSALDYGQIELLPDICVTRSGIYEVNFPVLYEVQLSDRVIELCDFDVIVDTLTNQYKHFMTDYTLTVMHCRLVEYPISTGSEQFQLIPVWLCITEEDLGEDAANTQKYVVAVNAVTGEVMTELED